MSSADRRETIGVVANRLRASPYGFALVAVTVATLVRYGFEYAFGFPGSFAVFYPAILIVALIAGFWPGFTATLLSALSIDVFFFDPRFSFSISHVNDGLGLALFVVAGVAISWLANSTRTRAAKLEEFERVVEGLDEMIVVVDRDYRYLIANRAFLIYRGMKSDEVIGRRIAEILNPGVFEATVKDRLDEAFRGQIVRYEMRYPYPNRGDRKLRITYLPIDGPGGVDRVACILEDTTDQEQAQGALRESEDRYRDLVEHSEDLVCTHDLEGRLLTVNAAPARILGYTVGELLQIPMRDLLVPEGREPFDAYLERLSTTGGPEKGLLCVRARSGEVRTWEYHNTLRIEGVAKPIVRGIAHDITERRKAELALQASGERYRTLFEKTVAAVGIISMDGRVIDCNDAWARMFGHDHAADCRGADMTSCYRDPSDRPILLGELKKTGVFHNREWELRRKDGSPLWVLLNSVLITEGNGESVIQSTMIDITERRVAEAELRRREEDYRQFVAQSSEGIFRQDLDAPIPIDLPEDELVQHILRDSFLAECNNAIVKMYGLNSVQDFQGRRLTEFVDPADPVNLELTREYVRSGFRVLERESHEVDVNGHEKVFRNSMIGIVEDGRLLRTWGIQRDVTEQVRLEGARAKAEAAVRVSEEHYRLLVEQASDGIFLADADGRYLEVNSAGANMLGYTRDEILRLSIADVVAPEEMLRITPEVARFDDGSIVLSEWRFRRKDGSFFVGEVCGRRLPDRRLQAIVRDITERRKAEDALRQSEERFRVALKDSPITVFNQDRDLRYTWIYNPQLHWQHEVLGKTDDEIIGPKAAAALNELKIRVLRSGSAMREEVAFPQNGHSQVFDITIEPLFDAGQNVIGITGAYMDIARLRQMADRLQEARDRLSQEKSYLESEIQTELGFEQIIGQSPALREVLKKARIVATTDSTVLLLGETGTGKELVARSVHALSGRRERTFVKLNCAAVPSGLLESELFGHEKGAFTGAVTQKIGRIELADRGTLFLDEIGELPLELQPKLLRVLQDREFERLGGVRTIKVDVRIVSATNRDLQQDIADKKFREDLFYRLNVFPIELPPLRERRDDIPLLVQHFVKKHAGRMGKRIDTVPDEAIHVLKNWSWPGNIRELENMIERMVIMSKDRTLAAPPSELQEPDILAEDSLTGMEREHIIRVLRETNGVLSGSDGAASRLGMKRTTLQSMMKRLGIETQEYRRADGRFGRL